MMSQRRTYGLGLATAGAIAYLLAMLWSGNAPTHKNRVVSESAGVLRIAPETIDRVAITYPGHALVYVYRESKWQAEADGGAVSAAIGKQLTTAITFMHSAPPVRVLRPEETAGVAANAYGLDPPAFSIELGSGADRALLAHFGARANDDIIQFMRLEGQGETFLVSGFVGDAWRSIIEQP